MTVVVVVKVFDGLVVAADSATTVDLGGGGHQVYNSANKIFQLHRQKPLVAATWGLGSLGPASIATLAKDLRRRLMGADESHADWALGDTYSVRDVAERVVEMMFDELYSPQVASGQSPRSVLGFTIGGYSSNQECELWTVQMEDPNVRPVPQMEAGDLVTGWSAYAIREAAMRLFNGYDPALEEELLRIVTDPPQAGAVQNALLAARRAPVLPGMPFVEAISLARFLANTTIGYAHYLLGPDIVGGAVEIAAVSRHEGFKWVDRKHYYHPDLNPKEPNHVV